MCCLDIIGVVVSPRSSHPFGILVVWYHIVIVGEWFEANRAYPFLLDNLPLEQFSHFSR